MRRFAGCVLLVAAGCCTHPVGEVCDVFRPGKMYKNRVAPYGGICQPQGLLPGPIGGIPAVPPPVVPPGGRIGAPFVPAPPGAPVPVPFSPTSANAMPDPAFP